MALELYLSRSLYLFGGVDFPAEKALVHIIGAPYDSTSSFRAGSREAPREIRWAAANIEFYSPRSGLDVEAVAIHDHGDVAVAVNPLDMVERLRRVVTELRERYPGRGLVVLGGEHTITYGVLAGLGRGTCLLVMDAHLDMRDEYMGHRYSHATFLRRALEDGLVEPTHVLHVGARAFVAEEASFSRGLGVRGVTALEVLRKGPGAVLQELEGLLGEGDCQRLHVSIDMDVFDPAYAPGVGNPEPEGLAPTHVLDILHAVVSGAAGKGLPVSLDVVEVSPPHDPGGVTSVLAAKLVVEYVAALAKTCGGCAARQVESPFRGRSSS